MNIEKILERLSGLLDSLYEWADDEEREAICEVEDDLHNFLKEKGLI
jgi:hypothetical protein